MEVFDLGFLLKKIIGAMMMPVPAVFLLFLLALITRLMGYRRFARGMVVTAVMSLFVLAHPFFAFGITAPLEHQYPKYDGQPVKAVIVLGGYHRSDPRKPVSSLLSPASLMRLYEGVRIHQANPGSKMLFSGYNMTDALSHAEAMSQIAQSMGVLGENIVKASKPRDTSEEAAHWAALAEQNAWQDNEVALVSTALHLPRAMYLFTKAGFHPIPAPTNFGSESPDFAYWKNWVPNTHALALTKASWHEHLGLIWAKTRSD